MTWLIRLTARDPHAGRTLLGTCHDSERALLVDVKVRLTVLVMVACDQRTDAVLQVLSWQRVDNGERSET